MDMETQPEDLSRLEKELAEARQALENANDQIRQQKAGLEALKKAAEEQAIHDPLTGLFSRKYLNEAIQQEFSRARRSGYQVSLLMLDIDHFSRIVDAYGPAAGDLALQAVADHLLHSTRGADLVCRIGGDEFLVMMYDTPTRVAMERAEQLRQGIANIDLDYEDVSFQWTVSIGVAAFPLHGAEYEEVLHNTELSLNRAKAAGRNCVKRFGFADK